MKINLGHITSTLTFSLLFLLCITIANAQTASFTHQGKFTGNMSSANGTYQMEFSLFDAAAGGNLVAAKQTAAAVTVTDGKFTVDLDFGQAAFDGSDRYLQASFFSPSSNVFVDLDGRPQIMSSPYAIQSLKAREADNATNASYLGNAPAGNFVQSSDTRLSDSRNPTAGSENYVQNRTTQQAAASFNISGNGIAGGTLSAGTVNAVDLFTLGGVRVLNREGTNNLFAGNGAGLLNNTGTNNSFFGHNAGNINTTASYNSFFGSYAGKTNVFGSDNSFFGNSAGFNNTNGGGNTFVGRNAGMSNTTGNNNTFLGYGANASTGTLVNAAAIGANAQVTTSNTMVLGTNAVTVRVPGNLFVGGTLTGNLPSGDSSYIQNGNSTQSNTNFNISGSGTLGGSLSASVVNVGGHYQIDGVQVLGKDSNGYTEIASGNGQVRTPGIFFADITRTRVFTATGTSTFEGPMWVQPALGGSNQLCRNGNGHLAYCSSSLRYKSNVENFSGGLDIVNRLRPVTFNWKDSGMKDLGLGAEEVAAVDPLLVIHNAEGQVEGVKYDRIGVVLLNAVKEQQAQIAEQKKQIEQQQSAIDSLKKLVCLTNAKADVCQ